MPFRRGSAQTFSNNGGALRVALRDLKIRKPPLSFPNLSYLPVGKLLEPDPGPRTRATGSPVQQTEWGGSRPSDRSGEKIFAWMDCAPAPQCASRAPVGCLLIAPFLPCGSERISEPNFLDQSSDLNLVIRVEERAKDEAYAVLRIAIESPLGGYLVHNPLDYALCTFAVIVKDHVVRL
jgi:hypothetical protein